MLIGIVSDAHLFHKNARTSVFKKLINDLQDKVDFIVDCGDLLDKNVVDSEQAAELFDIFNNIKVPYYIVKGNHDALNGVSLASLLPLNKNITVCNDVTVRGDFLFVPYVDSVSTLFKKLDSLDLEEPKKYMFSHLNITSNFYATFSLEDTEKLKQLFRYSSTIFNGHIHTPESKHTLFGDVYNVGSVSSLTYGDEHIPSYSIFDTKTNTFVKTEQIVDSIIHKTIKLTDDSYKDEIDDFVNKNSKMLINWRVQLPNTTDVETKQNIREYLKNFNNTQNICFSYLATVRKTEKDQNSLSKELKQPLVDLLIQQFSKDTGLKLKNDIIKELSR